MSKAEFEAYLALVGSLLQLTPEQRSQISDELYDHLENRVADLVSEGVDRDTAIIQAVEEFGDASALAKNLKKVSNDNRKRWMMRFATLCTAAAFLIGIFSMAMWPQEARFGVPASTIAQEDSPADPLESGDNPFGGDADPFGPNHSTVNSSTAKSSVAATASAKSVNEGIREKLLATCEVAFDETAYSDFEAFLEKELGINVILTTSAKEDSLTEDEVLSGILSGVSYSSMLRILLVDKNATYCVKDGVLKIISLDVESESRFQVRKMIDVSETLSIIRKAERDRIGKPMQSFTAGAAGSGGVGGAGSQGGGGGVFAIQGVGVNPAQKEVDGTTTREFAEAIAKAIRESHRPVHVPVQLVTAESMLLDAIVDSVAVDDWVDAGGYSSITCVGGILIVNASEAVSEEVQNFVEELTFNLKTAVEKR